eukprot:2584851-Alexandrium_andersonii.AAC.1
MPPGAEATPLATAIRSAHVRSQLRRIFVVASACGTPLKWMEVAARCGCAKIYGEKATTAGEVQASVPNKLGRLSGLADALVPDVMLYVSAVFSSALMATECVKYPFIQYEMAAAEAFSAW